MKQYLIQKNGKFVRDFSDGERFTVIFSLAERYTSKKAAAAMASLYGRRNGKGYKVVSI